jgi:hypothetical protein
VFSFRPLRQIKVPAEGEASNNSVQRERSLPRSGLSKMFEHRTKPLLPRKTFLKRALRSLALALGIVGVSLGLGIFGYHFCAELPWLDALLNAAMILTGMGPVNELHTVLGKFFASFYALFSGVVFVTSVAILLAPLIHRFLHKFHLQSEDPDDDRNQTE